jgi:hypothetical protein
MLYTHRCAYNLHGWLHLEACRGFSSVLKSCRDLCLPCHKCDDDYFFPWSWSRGGKHMSHRSLPFLLCHVPSENKERNIRVRPQWERVYAIVPPKPKHNGHQHPTDGICVVCACSFCTYHFHTSCYSKKEVRIVLLIKVIPSWWNELKQMLILNKHITN